MSDFWVNQVKEDYLPPEGKCPQCGGQYFKVLIHDQMIVDVARGESRLDENYAANPLLLECPCGWTKDLDET